MNITSLPATPVHALQFRNARPGGGGVVVVDLPVFVGTVEGLHAGVDCLVFASDLQGRELQGGRLLGEVVPAWLLREGLVSDPSSTVALLSGDLYASPSATERGATGDVRSVWRAFGSAFSAVVGVMGNHDLLGEDKLEAFARREAVTILDGEVKTIEGLRVGGVSGIVGKVTKPNRHTEEGFQSKLEAVLADDPDIVLLHQGPSGDEPRDKGSPAVRQTLEAVSRPPIVAFGHCHWTMPLTKDERRQWLNVDGRVVILQRA